MQAVDLVAWAFLCLLIGWVGFMLWSTYLWLWEGLEEARRRGEQPPAQPGDLG